MILTKTDIKAEAIGSGKKVRGRRHRNWRPDLIVLDDIENDENVNTPEQRRKLKNWFDKAVSKAGDTYTDIMYIGTILHYDSLLNNVLQNPRYKTKKYRAGDASYGWSLLDFMQGEYDDFTQMEIQQRIRSKMSKRDYIDAGSIQTTVNFDGHIYHIRIAFRRTDSNSEYNIDIESNGVEVIVE